MHFNDSASTTIKWNGMEWIRGTGAWIYVQVINIPFKLFKATTRLSLESNNKWIGDDIENSLIY